MQENLLDYTPMALENNVVVNVFINQLLCTLP